MGDGGGRVPRGAQRTTGILAYLTVALLSLAVGVTATWLVLREETLPAASAPVSRTSRSADAGAVARAGAPAARPEVKPVRITPERQQLIGVRTARVETRDLSLRIRTVGVIGYDETRLAEIHTKVAGWVEKVNVDYVGKRVRRGDPLLALYSPELVSTQNEYLLSLGLPSNALAAQPPGRQAGGGRLSDASRRRLRLLDFTEKQIAELERTREPTRTVTLFSPANGVIVERNTFRGQYLTPEMSAVKIADLSTVWVMAELFENESAAIRVGQAAEVELHGARPTSVEGKVDFIFPSVDPRTRRVKVRIALENPGDVLKPESYVTVVLESSLGRMLAIPKEAVIDNGDRAYALLALPDGYFQPRDVKLGVATEDHYAVLDGFEEGDRVVTSAQFLIDSETNLAAAMKAMSMSMPGMDMSGDEGAESMPGMDMARPDAAPATAPMDPNVPMPGHEHNR